jgi:hypothetical protein
MATAKLVLPNGASVTIEGTPEEVHQLMQLYASTNAAVKGGGAPRRAPASQDESPAEPRTPQFEGDVIAAVVNQIKSSSSAEAIESKILDQRSQMNRILLPLFIINMEMNDEFGLTSGEIAKVTRQLGVPVGQPDVSKILAKEAARYVLGDSARTPGRPVRYKLSRRGVQYVESLLGS